MISAGILEYRLILLDEIKIIISENLVEIL